MRRRDVDQLVDEEVAQRVARAPMVRVRLRGDCEGRRCPSVRGRAKVDTGAQHTFIAPSVVEQLGLERVGRDTIRGLGGSGRKMDRYAVQLSVEGHDLPLLVAGAYAYPHLDQRGEVALIGRDAMAGGDDRRAAVRLEYDGATGRVAVKSRRRATGK